MATSGEVALRLPHIHSFVPLVINHHREAHRSKEVAKNARLCICFYRHIANRMVRNHTSCCICKSLYQHSYYTHINTEDTTSQ